MTNILNIIVCETSKLSYCLSTIVYSKKSNIFIFEGLSVIILFFVLYFFLYISCENVFENYLISLYLFFNKNYSFLQTCYIILYLLN